MELMARAKTSNGGNGGGAPYKLLGGLRQVFPDCGPGTIPLMLELRDDAGTSSLSFITSFFGQAAIPRRTCGLPALCRPACGNFGATPYSIEPITSRVSFWQTWAT